MLVQDVDEVDEPPRFVLARVDGQSRDVLHANHFESLGERDVIARRRARSPPANIIEREPRVRAHASLRAQTTRGGDDVVRVHFAFALARLA